ncbi:hypothetical protein BT93_E2913 [Corymbia citriodora subsp. variegata]|nr:hypothetical protein BT93_E2913 [Corymbia citriodora subsp. variegata]
MGVGGRPRSADAGGHRSAMMGAKGRPTSADPGDPVTRVVATDAKGEAPVHHRCHMVVVMNGHRFAMIPATTSAINPACKCKESSVVLVETGFSFPWIRTFMISVRS